MQFSQKVTRVASLQCLSTHFTCSGNFPFVRSKTSTLLPWFFFFFIVRLFLLRLFSLLFHFSERIRNSSYQKREIKRGLSWIHCQNKTICSWGFYSEDLVPGPFPSSSVCFMWFRQPLLWVSLPLFIWENMAVYSRTCSVCTRRVFSSLKVARSQSKWKEKQFLKSCDCLGLLPDLSSSDRHVAYKQEKCITSTG